MGLIKSSYDIKDTGIILNDVYMKITSFNFYANNNNCFFQLSIFQSKILSDEGKMPIDNYTNSFTISDPNSCIRTGIYNYVKTLPEFQDVEDLI